MMIYNITDGSKASPNGQHPHRKKIFKFPLMGVEWFLKIYHVYYQCKNCFYIQKPINGNLTFFPGHPPKIVNFSVAQKVSTSPPPKKKFQHPLPQEMLIPPRKSTASPLEKSA